MEWQHTILIAGRSLGIFNTSIDLILDVQKKKSGNTDPVFLGNIMDEVGSI